MSAANNFSRLVTILAFPIAILAQTTMAEATGEICTTQVKKDDGRILECRSNTLFVGSPCVCDLFYGSQRTVIGKVVSRSADPITLKQQQDDEKERLAKIQEYREEMSARCAQISRHYPKITQAICLDGGSIIQRSVFGSIDWQVLKSMNGAQYAVKVDMPPIPCFTNIKYFGFDQNNKIVGSSEYSNWEKFCY
jgi:hypothetical protein